MKEMSKSLRIINELIDIISNKISSKTANKMNKSMIYHKHNSFLNDINLKRRKKLRKVPTNEIHIVKQFYEPCDLIFCKELSGINIGNIYVGSKGVTNKNNFDALKVRNINIVISLSNHEVISENKLSHIKYHYFKSIDRDYFNIKQYFDITYDIINNGITNNNNILIHCDMGVSRSGSIIVAYFIKKLRISYNNALKMVKESRKCIQPNKGFVKQLILYSKELNIL